MTVFQRCTLIFLCTTSVHYTNGQYFLQEINEKIFYNLACKISNEDKQSQKFFAVSLQSKIIIIINKLSLFYAGLLSSKLSFKCSISKKKCFHFMKRTESSKHFTITASSKDDPVRQLKKRKLGELAFIMLCGFLQCSVRTLYLHL